ncbi:uncharacterized protein FSUBG_9216 [Fusarium subglutinans]|uniref:Uncharacterized protein n=1 Tax=Gibberella subglutinans TaxID=42677 RepID=A0A8H5URS4_GIBSU|nr:uncharacterized protein FSUBG_9216 [Fusarium subglutinans]KAF5595159.1 hypothetical protein FSUBG_9216 [Fusarium subglutinans]
MSQSTGATPRRSIPFLPPELSLRIIQESEETPVCLVNHLSRGMLQCDGGLQDHTTVIYTRGEKQTDGALSRGRLEALPMQHRCVAGLIRPADTPALPFDPSDDYSLELEISHLTKRTVVAELGLDEDIANPVLNLDKHALPPYYDPHKFINIRYVGYDLLNRHFIATVPIEIGGDDDIRPLTGITRNQSALTHRLRPDDEKLACEKMKHLMIRESNLSEGHVLDTLTQLADNLVTVQDVNRWSAHLIIYRDVLRSSPLHPRWELLTNLETLCIDMTQQMMHHKSPLMGVQINKMARHLNLKTLILLGTPCRARFDYMTPNGEAGEEAWVTYLENNLDLGYDATHGRAINYLFLFKNLVRPGGQIHFIADRAPGTAYWPGPNAGVGIMAEGLQ